MVVYDLNRTKNPTQKIDISTESPACAQTQLHQTQISYVPSNPYKAIEITSFGPNEFKNCTIKLPNPTKVMVQRTPLREQLEIQLGSNPQSRVVKTVLKTTGNVSSGIKDRIKELENAKPTIKKENGAAKKQGYVSKRIEQLNKEELENVKPIAPKEKLNFKTTLQARKNQLSQNDIQL